MNCLNNNKVYKLIQYVVYLILFLSRMLHYSQIAKLIKPIIGLNFIKILLFLSLSIFLIISRKGQMFTQNDVAQYCSPYLNHKISLYRKPAQLMALIMVILGVVFTLVDFVNFLVFYIRTRRKLTSKTQDNLQYTQNRLRFNFILGFLESICLINVFIRSVEQFKELSACEITQKTTSIVSIVLSGLIIPALVGNLWILFKFLALMNKKLETLQKFTLYSDDRTLLRENLFFNKRGYIKQLFKIQNYSSRSTSLKNQTIKGLPSGYKKPQFSPTRQIIFKLLGGNKTQFQKTPINQEVRTEQNQFSTDLDQTLDRTKPKNEKQDLISTWNQNQNSNQLHVYQKRYHPEPNNENIQNITTTLNILQVMLRNKLAIQTQKDQNSNDQSDKQDFTKISNVKRNLNGKKVSQNDRMPKHLRQEEELKQKFNLTPNIQARKKYENIKNWQNIDQNGHYYKVNIDKIKNKTKLMNFIKFSDDKDQIDPNALYSKRQWVRKKKRTEKKHERNVQQYLRNLAKLRKEEMLCEFDHSQDESQDFEKDERSEEQSEYLQNGEENEESQQIEQIQANEQEKDQKNQQVVGEGKDSSNPAQKKQKSKKPRNRKPQLYLHMRKKKHPVAENQLKLYEDEEGFYDDVDCLQSSQENIQEKDDLETGIQEIYQKGLVRESSSQRQRPEEKIQLKNKQLDNNEAERLRFIRKKYIESKQLIQQINHKNDKLSVVFQEDGQNQTVQKH